MKASGNSVLRASLLVRSIALATLLAGVEGCNSRPAAPAVALHDAHDTGRSLALVDRGDGPPVPVAEDLIRSDVYFLSSPRLEGRGVGTEGLELAADYIAARFEALGLKPLPALSGYFQPLEMTVSEAMGSDTFLAAGDKKYEMDEQFTALRMSAEKAFSGPVVFVGYGATNEGLDDYAGVDVEGKVVLAMRYEPHDPDTGKSRWAAKGEDWSTHAHLETKAKNAAEHGAAALVLVNPPLYHDHGDDPLLTYSRSVGSGVSIPVVQVKRAVAEDWLKRSGVRDDLRALQKKLDGATETASMELKGVSVKGKVSVVRTKRKVRNVVAYLPGSGPTAEEYVVIGAHYDHLGFGGRGSLHNTSLLRSVLGMPPPAATQATTRAVGPPATRRAIHPGADDNASGTAAMLEAARIFSHRARQNQLPARTLIFAAFTGEESGLVGSSHFVNNPPLHLKKVAAMVNLDMVGRVSHNLLRVGGWGTAAPLEGIMKRVDQRSTLEFTDFGKGGLGPSDHMSFAQKKIPVLFLFSGQHEDYHRPSDVAPKVNYKGLAHVAAACVDFADELARMPKSAYVDAADRHSMIPTMTSSGSGTGERRASLGVVPHYGGEQDGKGVLIGGTTAGTAAEKAGLQAGDVVLQLGDKPTGTLEELSIAIGAHKPGDKVMLKYRRGEKVMTAEVTLTARGG